MMLNNNGLALGVAMVMFLGLAPAGQSADKSESNKKLNAKLIYAVADGKIEQVRRLIAEGADVNAGDGPSGIPVVFFTLGLLPKGIIQDDVAMLKLLVSKGAKLDSLFGDTRQTLLMHASESGAIHCFEFLLMKGADINATDRMGDTALMKAASNSRAVKIMSLLLAKGADLNYAVGDDGKFKTTFGNFGHTALKNAAYASNLEAVNFLIKNGANVNDNKGGVTALIYAQTALKSYPNQKNIHEVIQILEAAGASNSANAPSIKKVGEISPGDAH